MQPRSGVANFLNGIGGGILASPHEGWIFFPESSGAFSFSPLPTNKDGKFSFKALLSKRVK